MGTSRYPRAPARVVKAPTMAVAPSEYHQIVNAVSARELSAPARRFAETRPTTKYRIPATSENDALTSSVMEGDV